MWVGLTTAVLVATMLCYIPGYILFRALGFSSIVALCVAPIYSICLYGALPIVYYELGISCNALTIIAPTLGIALCGYGFARAKSAQSTDARGLRYGPISPDLRIPVLYVGLAAIVCVGVFVMSLADPDAFFSRYDNQMHLNLVRSFLDSGKWSSLHASTYLATPLAARPIASNGGFYPAAWHDVVALICLICSVSVTVGTNALIIATCAIMLPLGSYALVTSLFPKRPYAVTLGAVATVGFANWPWLTITSGPLYPFLLGLSLLTSSLSVVIASVTTKHVQNNKFSLVCFATCSFITLALAHPSTVFTAYVICAGLGAHMLWQYVTTATSSRAKRLGIMLAYTIALVLVWVACYHVPALQSTLNYNKDSAVSPLRALGSLLSLRLRYTTVQVGMGLASAFGVIAVWRCKDVRWILLPIAFFALSYFVSAINAPFFEHWLCGPWYSDVRRLCENLTILLIPVAAVGMATILEVLTARHGALAGRLAIAAIVVVTFIPYVWVPSSEGLRAWGLGTARDRVMLYYGYTEEQVYSEQEIEFVNRANKLIPAGSRVINAPGDGSAWAYAVNGTNTYYRTMDIRGQTDDAQLIRTNLNDYATNQQVRDAVRRIGATYVLLLDQNVPYEQGVWLQQYTQNAANYWTGITSINDQTPGFSVVLAEGDMRLYRIDVAGEH